MYSNTLGTKVTPSIPFFTYFPSYNLAVRLNFRLLTLDC